MNTKPFYLAVASVMLLAIHVKIVQPGGKTLTTQLFSAGYTKQNAEDGIFDAIFDSAYLS